MDPTLIGAIVAALLGGITTYIVAARKLSGRIRTTEADRLWDEASNLRKEYRQTSEELRGSLEDCRERIIVLEHDNERLHIENGRLIKRVEELTRENEQLRQRVHELEATNGTA